MATMASAAIRPRIGPAVLPAFAGLPRTLWARTGRNWRSRAVHVGWAASELPIPKSAITPTRTSFPMRIWP